MNNNIIFLIFIFIASACSKSDSESAYSTQTGVGGSTARFTIVGNYLYTVNVNNLKTFNIEQPDNPVYVSEKEIGTDIETIFSFNNYLLIGSMNGVYFYNVSNPSSPQHVSTYNHIKSCDPVVANGNYAYVTLNSNQSFCGNYLNELQVLNISNIYSPYLLYNVNMINPKGLAVNDSLLFVCDNGIKMYSIKNIATTSPSYITMQTNNSHDVVLIDSTLYAIEKNALHQFRVKSWGIQTLSTLQF